MQNGPIWSRFEARSGPSWAELGASWSQVGAKVSQVGVTLMPSWAKLVPSWGQVGAKLGPSWGQDGAKFGQVGAKFGQVGFWAKLGANLEPTWRQNGAKLEPKKDFEPNWGPSWSQLGSTWSQLGAKMEPSWDQKSTKIGPKSDPKCNHFLIGCWNGFEVDFCRISHPRSGKGNMSSRSSWETTRVARGFHVVVRKNLIFQVSSSASRSAISIIHVKHEF